MASIDIDRLCTQFPLIKKLITLDEVAWFNPKVKSLIKALPDVGLTQSDIDNAASRLRRFAPYLAKAFPETAVSNGIIESPFKYIPHMQAQLEQHYQAKLSGKLLLKMDNQLPISGSVKARGGIYEVLVLAERLAIQAGLLNESDDYATLHSVPFKTFFNQFTISVGSTGNLGLSIGIVAAELGFQVSVHMSSDAREWKKNKLKSHGVKVIEYTNDYSEAVFQGREEAKTTPSCFFIDDENSHTLFLGYAVAGQRLKQQFDQTNIIIDEHHPLFVYLPCGVGGGPGGISFGLKLAFGDHVHCIFAEPTHSPCMLLGVYSGLHDQICVQDLNIDNVTAADGLAVGRASGFVGRAMQHLIDGFITVHDEELFTLLNMLHNAESIQLEPSALAGMPGAIRAMNDADYIARLPYTPDALKNAIHLVWATGGGMVPTEEMASYLSGSTN